MARAALSAGGADSDAIDGGVTSAATGATGVRVGCAGGSAILGERPVAAVVTGGGKDMPAAGPRAGGLCAIGGDVDRVAATSTLGATSSGIGRDGSGACPGRTDQ